MALSTLNSDCGKGVSRRWVWEIVLELHLHINTLFSLRLCIKDILIVRQSILHIWFLLPIN